MIFPDFYLTLGKYFVSTQVGAFKMTLPEYLQYFHKILI